HPERLFEAGDSSALSRSSYSYSNILSLFWVQSQCTMTHVLPDPICRYIPSLLKQVRLRTAAGVWSLQIINPNLNLGLHPKRFHALPLRHQNDRPAELPSQIFETVLKMVLPLRSPDFFHEQGVKK
ncbi:hypothetical protein, partial [Flavilitoribacter nigricans]|uniref:hypothetical protein n=1 Tax=Flavilitoribacter nigricans TaxID=70997 RepID=UPI001C9E466F